MSRTIRVDEQLYKRLEQLRDWKESFSQVIERLLKIHDGLGPLINIVRGSQKYQEWLNDRLKKEVPTH